MHLNYVRTGIGGLLKLLRDYHRKPTHHFIERLRTAPEITYNTIRLESIPYANSRSGVTAL
jgi:hypothetical protein